MKKRGIAILLKAVVSVGLIAYLFARADLSAWTASLRDMRIGMFVAALATTFVALSLRAYKWHLLLKVQGASTSVRRLLNLIVIGMFFNNFFLGSLGGDAFRVYRTIGDADSKSGAALSVVLDRATGFVMAVVLVLVLGARLVASQSDLVSVELLLVVALLGILCVGAFSVLGMRRARTRRIPILRRFPRIAGLVAGLASSLHAYRRHTRVVIASLVLSLLFYLAHSSTFYFFTRAANADVSMMAILFIVPLVGLLVMIPISLNGIGVQEGFYVLYLERLGVTPERALLIAVTARLAKLLVSATGGLLFLLCRRREAFAHTAP